MDIEYLLFLQRLRENGLEFITPVMYFISGITESAALIWIFACLYWIFDKRTGSFVFLNNGLGVFASQSLKLTACVYRPWIRDARVLPVGDAMARIASYSFPGGHTTVISTYALPLIYTYRKKYRVLSILLGALILLVAFSRNFLGVHTPQDVLFAIAEIMVVTLIVSRIMTYLDKNPKKDIVVALVIFFIVAAVTIYLLLKPYPMDYVNGKLLVDPDAMKHKLGEIAGPINGTLVGLLIERRLIGFTNQPKRAYSYIVAAISFVPIYLINNVLTPMLTACWGKMLGTFVCMFIQPIFILAIVPLILKCFERKKQ